MGKSSWSASTGRTNVLDHNFTFSYMFCCRFRRIRQCRHENHVWEPKSLVRGSDTCTYVIALNNIRICICTQHLEPLCTNNMTATSTPDGETKEDFSATQYTHTLETSLASEGQADDAPPKDTTHYGWRFWMIILSLCFTSLLTAIEATVTATALPSIARELDFRELYVWFVNALFLSR